MSQIYASHRHQQKQAAAPEQAKMEPAAAQPANAALAGTLPGVAMESRVDLPDQIRGKMERAFGADLSGVQLYESRAVADAGARAVTMGGKIGFAPGETDFTSTAGQALLGHELSHVVSQARGEVAGGGFLNDPALEARADREGAMAAAGETLSAAPLAPLSASTVASAAGPMQAKKGKDEGKLGSDEKIRALYDAQGKSKVTADMNAAFAKSTAEGNESNHIYSDTMQASGFRTDKMDSAAALKEREGTAFSGLSKKISALARKKEKGGAVNFARMQRERSTNIDTGAFGGANFSYSPEISSFSTDAMKTMDPYLDRGTVGQYMSDQYDLIKDADMFKSGKQGSALDAVMLNLFNRQFGLGAFSEFKMDKFNEGDEEGGKGVAAVNSFVTRLPNLVRDVETGNLKESQIPDHMKPAFEQYRAMRAKVGARVDPERYSQKTAAAAPVQAAAPAAPQPAAPQPAQAQKLPAEYQIDFDSPEYQSFLKRYKKTSPYMFERDL